MRQPTTLPPLLAGAFPRGPVQLTIIHDCPGAGCLHCLLASWGWVRSGVTERWHHRYGVGGEGAMMTDAEAASWQPEEATCS